MFKQNTITAFLTTSLRVSRYDACSSRINRSPKTGVSVKNRSTSKQEGEAHKALLHVGKYSLCATRAARKKPERVKYLATAGGQEYETIKVMLECKTKSGHYNLIKQLTDENRPLQ